MTNPRLTFMAAGTMSAAVSFVALPSLVLCARHYQSFDAPYAFFATQ